MTRRVYRLTGLQYAGAIWSGSGAMLTGHRWTPPGVQVIYTADTLALAQLERLVQLAGISGTPPLALAVAQIPDKLATTRVAVEELPRSWQRFRPYPPALQKIGVDWIERGETAVLAVPSAVSPPDCNLLLNPLHPDFKRIDLGRTEPFSLDLRLRR